MEDKLLKTEKVIKKESVKRKERRKRQEAREEALRLEKIKQKEFILKIFQVLAAITSVLSIALLAKDSYSMYIQAENMHPYMAIIASILPEIGVLALLLATSIGYGKVLNTLFYTLIGIISFYTVFGISGHLSRTKTAEILHINTDIIEKSAKINTINNKNDRISTFMQQKEEIRTQISTKKDILQNATEDYRKQLQYFEKTNQKTNASRATRAYNKSLASLTEGISSLESALLDLNLKINSTPNKGHTTYLRGEVENLEKKVEILKEERLLSILFRIIYVILNIVSIKLLVYSIFNRVKA